MRRQQEELRVSAGALSSLQKVTVGEYSSCFGVTDNRLVFTDERGDHVITWPIESVSVSASVAGFPIVTVAFIAEQVEVVSR